MINSSTTESLTNKEVMNLTSILPVVTSNNQEQANNETSESRNPSNQYQDNKGKQKEGNRYKRTRGINSKYQHRTLQ